VARIVRPRRDLRAVDDLNPDLAHCEQREERDEQRAEPRDRAIGQGVSPEVPPPVLRSRKSV
jgi:hypothetical protein